MIFFGTIIITYLYPFAIKIKVILEEIKKIVSENHDKTVEFIDCPAAQQYRETEMIKKQNQ